MDSTLSQPPSRLGKKIQAKHLLLMFFVLLMFLLIFCRNIFGSHSLYINEVMSSNQCTIPDEDGDYADWCELYNAGTTSLDLEGYWLSDDPTNPLRWEFPAVTIAPGEYLLIFTSGKDRSDPAGPYLHTNFSLSEGETLIVSSPEMRPIDSVELGPLYANVSWGRHPRSSDLWLYYLTATPGVANATLGYEQFTREPAKNINVQINEFMTTNRTSIMDLDGDLSDWIEFYNAGDTEQNLEGFWLSDSSDDPFKWRFPEIILQPGEYLLVFASGKNSTADKHNLHTNFKLNQTQEQLVFSTAEGHSIEEIDFSQMIANVSYGRSPDSTAWFYYPLPTPGRGNETQGHKNLTGTTLPLSYQLHLNEVQTMNRSTLHDEDGDFTDWIELYNAGTSPIDLAGFGLSDQEAEPFRWKLPAVTMEPQSYLLVFASGKDRRTPAKNLHTNFKLNLSGETILLTAPSGERVDSLVTGRLESGLSAGRYPDGANGRHFFMQPSPGASNTGTPLTGRAPEPVFSTPGGFYDDTITLTLAPSLSLAGAVIRYTTNGQEPTANSPLYKSPLSLNKTTIIRAKCFANGLLASKTANNSYFIKENTPLTVISILIDPQDLWDKKQGIYVLGSNADPEFPHVGANFWQDWEKPSHLQLYETNGKLGLSTDVGLRIGGQYSRAMPQKAFNIFARNQYGSDVLEYPFFPDKELTTQKAITLRQSGQDATMSKIRDCLMTSLLSETTLDYQAYRPAIVYLNGEYWGIYNIRERINEYFLAYNHDLNPQQIDLLQGNTIVRAGDSKHYVAMREFVADHDMSKQENYDYLQTQMDLDNFIDYWLAEIYFANTDNANIRFWREKSDAGKWRWIVYDTDWGFFNVNHNTLASVTNPEGTGVGRNLYTTLLVNLLKNKDFKTKFIQRGAYHLKHTFSAERVIQRIDEMASVIEPEMPKHLKRWGGSMSEWQYHIQRLKNFAEKRPALVANHFQNKFNLSSKEMEIFTAR
ncbi:MAG TPA: CotH kinase family protein [Oscillospiraceae bacterium]|nr:CotH kinase family protein [Oscillospiraceae bacterium]